MARTGITRIEATIAKNQFGMLMKKAKRGPVMIEKHGKPAAVVLDAATYEELRRKARSAHEALLDALNEEFDELYAEMQKKSSRKTANALLSASADQLNAVSVKRSARRA